MPTLHITHAAAAAAAAAQGAGKGIGGFFGGVAKVGGVGCSLYNVWWFA
jgi:hypothetical protein